MFEFLHKKINETIDITDEQFEYAKTLFVPKQLGKKRLLLERGNTCIYTTFVGKGLLRSFTIDEKGNENILQFAMEGWWVGDLYSFLTDEASEYTIEALEDSQLLLITKPSWDLLLEKVPAFERYFRVLIQNNLIATQRRLMNTMTISAEERYIKLLQDFPDISQRVPQHMIASYIGVTRETLSRLRSQMASG
ncbi:Crp/Fnr family transcriptional regulator [Gelidibacter sp.]|uniref:Crp/Fnr family transcriptional regulator n=1 Tax=Gelidibacter sp. TaxID=2018083 RepID=UPI002C66D890|nr:Crp/Fnr family transcriptional regulator [Gelidibacter sp.]HUH28690.1 Crp/Fnr family transcriptional regulator [Gelidibacter sp.]